MLQLRHQVRQQEVELRRRELQRRLGRRVQVRVETLLRDQVEVQHREHVRVQLPADGATSTRVNPFHSERVVRWVSRVGGENLFPWILG